MMNKRKIICLVVAVCLVVSSLPSVTAANSKLTDIQPYEYQLTPYSTQWTEFDTKAEKLALLQIPAEKLNAMTTEALLETVLKFPYYLDYIFYESLEGAYTNIYSTFNGFRELVERSDFANVLIKSYKSAELMTEAEYAKRQQTNAVGSTEQFFYVSSLEFLIVSAMINNRLTVDQRAELIKLVNNKDIARSNNPLYSKANNLCTNYLVSKNMVSELTSRDSEDEYNVSSWTYTPNGSIVPTIYNQAPELTSQTIQGYHDYASTNYPDAIRLGPATVKYNCHSYAWYSQTTNNKQWMPNPSAYMTDGSYTYVTGQRRVGMKVFWPYNSDGTHSGVLTELGYSNGSYTYYITSKWGPGGLYKHIPDDCPYYGSIQFYALSGT